MTIVHADTAKKLIRFSDIKDGDIFLYTTQTYTAVCLKFVKPVLVSSGWIEYNAIALQGGVLLKIDSRQIVNPVLSLSAEVETL